MYPFLTLDNGTEIVHSGVLPDHRVKVYMEKPDATDGFHYAVYLRILWLKPSGFPGG